MSFKVVAVQEGKLGQILGQGIASYTGAVKLGDCWTLNKTDRRYLVIIEPVEPVEQTEQKA